VIGSAFSAVFSWFSADHGSTFLTAEGWWRSWWSAGGVGALIGTIWGIDANFVTSDFLQFRWQRTIVRSLRFLIWCGGLGYALFLLGFYLFFDGISPGNPDRDIEVFVFGFPVIGGVVGAMIAFVTTLRDH
jgi:hypothetical protein